GELEALDLSDEPKDVASLPTGVAVVDLLRRTDRERRRLLRVERTQPDQRVPARLLELQISGDDLDEVGSLPNRLDVFGSNASGHPSSPWGLTGPYSNHPWGRKSCSYVRRANRSVIPAM